MATVELAGKLVEFPDGMPEEEINQVLDDEMKRAEQFADFISRPEYYAQGGDPVEGATSALLATPIIGDIAGLAMDAHMYLTDEGSHNWYNYLFSAMGVLPIIPSKSQVQAAVDKVPEIRKKVSLADYQASQLPSKKVKKKPQHIKDLRGEIAEKRRVRSLGKMGGDLPIDKRLDHYKQQKAGSARMDALLNDENASFWGADDLRRIQDATAIGDNPHVAKAKANLKGAVRELKKLGWEPRHVSEHGGKTSSYYMVKDGREVRLSDHALPETAARVSNREAGLGGKWQDEVIIDDVTSIQEVIDGFTEP